MTEPEEEQYLCKLYKDEDCRFVNFINKTGRPVRLTSKLQMVNYANQTWRSTTILQPASSHLWRFLGDQHNRSLYSLSLLPDPYKLALNNTYSWTVEYLDTDENSDIFIGSQIRTLDLQRLEEIGPGETVQIDIQRYDQRPCSLLDLALDTISMRRDVRSEKISNLEIPQTLRSKLTQLLSDYSDFRGLRLVPCDRCGEVHY